MNLSDLSPSDLIHLKKLAMRDLGRIGGSRKVPKGGAMLSPKARSEAMSKASKARWKAYREEKLKEMETSK